MNKEVKNDVFENAFVFARMHKMSEMRCIFFEGNYKVEINIDDLEQSSSESSEEDAE